MLPWQVHGQDLDGAGLTVHGKAKHTIGSFVGCDVPRVKVLPDLVDRAFLAGGCINLQIRAVGSLMNVLEDVLHRLDTGADLHVQVTVVTQQHDRVVRHHPSRVATLWRPDSCVAASVGRVGAGFDGGAIDGWARVVPATDSISHAGALRVLVATRPVHHVFAHGRVEVKL